MAQSALWKVLGQDSLTVLKLTLGIKACIELLAIITIPNLADPRLPYTVPAISTRAMSQQSLSATSARISHTRQILIGSGLTDEDVRTTFDILREAEPSWRQGAITRPETIQALIERYLSSRPNTVG